MSLDKAIQHGKEHRKPYRGSKRFDPACRNNTCPYCLGNKLHATRRREVGTTYDTATIYVSKDTDGPIEFWTHSA